MEHPVLLTEIKGDAPEGQWLAFLCTNDGSILLGHEAYDNICVCRDEEGVTVYVFTNRIIDIIEGERPYLVTRYDGHTNKIWIRAA